MNQSGAESHPRPSADAINANHHGEPLAEYVANCRSQLSGAHAPQVVVVGLDWWPSDCELPAGLVREVGLRASVQQSGSAIEFACADDVWVDLVLRLLSLAPLDLGPEPIAVDVPIGPSPPTPTVGSDSLVSRLFSALAVAVASAVLVDSARPRVQELAVQLLRGSAARANSILRGSPHLHAAAIDLLRRNNVIHFPYSVLNEGLAQDLVIAYGFPPFTDTSGLVFARRVLERGRVVDVISKDLTGRAREDSQSGQIVQEFVDRHVLVGGDATFDDWQLITQYCLSGWDALHTQLRAGQYQRIFSRAMWPASHLLAAMYKLTYPHVRWVAEFSDPMRRDPANRRREVPIGAGPLTEALTGMLADAGIDFPGEQDLYAWVEDLPYLLADELLFTNASQLDFMTSYLSPAQALGVRGKATVEHHPTPPSHYYRRPRVTVEFPPDRVNLGYFGMFYPTRGLSSIAAALRALRPELRERIRLHVFCPRPVEMAQLAEQSGLSNQIVAHPYLSYFDFLAVTTQLDCLLVDDFQTAATHPRNPYLPSKWSDYVGSGTPIWRIVEPGSVLASMKSMYVSDLDDVAGATRVLTEIVEIGPRRAHTVAVSR